MWLQRPSRDGGLARKAVVQLVQSQTQVPDTEGKQVLWTANQLALGMGNPVAWGLPGA